MKDSASDKASHNKDEVEDGTMCQNCGNPLEACMCACPYCGQVDSCECCLYDAATGGG